jgi:hypothetical protein
LRFIFYFFYQYSPYFYRSAFAIGGIFPRQLPPLLTAFLLIKEEELKMSHVAKLPACPMSRLLKCPAMSVFKRLILRTPLCQHLLPTMRTNLILTRTVRKGRSLNDLPSCMQYYSSVQLKRAKLLFCFCIKEIHISCMETLNKYLGMITTTKNSPLAVTFTDLGNVPFNKASLGSNIMVLLRIAWRWRNQYY